MACETIRDDKKISLRISIRSLYPIMVSIAGLDGIRAQDPYQSTGFLQPLTLPGSSCAGISCFVINLFSYLCNPSAGFRRDTHIGASHSCLASAFRSGTGSDFPSASGAGAYGYIGLHRHEQDRCDD